jgi:prevent-host-death family protein
LAGARPIVVEAGGTRPKNTCMKTAGQYEADSSMGPLLDRLEHGEEVTITRKGKPVARLIAVEHANGARVDDAVRGLKNFRDTVNRPPATMAEILAARHEGLRP